MAAIKTFEGITTSVWRSIKAKSQREHGTTYVPGDSNQGASTTSTPVGPVVLAFDFNEALATVTYTIQNKPFIINENQIWSSIEKTILECRQSGQSA